MYHSPSPSPQGRIRKRILLPLIGTISLLQGIFIIAFFAQQQQRIEREQQNLEEEVVHTFEDEIKHISDGMKAVMTAMVRDPRLTEDLRSLDFTALERHLAPLFAKLHQGQEFTHLAIYRKDRTPALHLQEEHQETRKRSIRVNRRETILKAEKTRSPSEGIEPDLDGRVALRIVFPWFEDIPELTEEEWFGDRKPRQLLGYLELGTELSHLLKHTADDMLGGEVILAVEKSFLDRALWKASARESHVLGEHHGTQERRGESHWEDFPHLVVTHQTAAEIPPAIAGILAETENASKRKPLRYSREGKTYLAMFAPFQNSKGETFGYAIALKNITDLVVPARKAMTIAIGCAVLLSGGLVGLFYVLLGRVERDLVRNRQHLIQTQEELQISGERLQATNADLKAILANLADGLLVTDAEGIITRDNPALQKMFELGEQEMIGLSCRDIGRSQLAELIERVQNNGSEALIAEIALMGDRIGQAVATPILESVNNTQIKRGTVILIRDITQEKEVDRMKTDFISTVSHELRTPLTSVLGFASIVQEKLEEDIFPQLPDGDRKVKRTIRRVRDNIDIIVSEAERLTALINDVLDIAKMEAGKLDWKMEEIDLAEIVDRSLAAVSSLLTASGLVLNKEIALDLPEIVGDRDRLIQVIINLLSNAIKFTEAGTISTHAEVRNEEILISITDTGMGIAPEDVEKVFDKFKQVGETLTDKPKGTGLGLPICKQIIEHHGGRIWVDSKLGEGSTFSFVLPLHASPSISDPDRFFNIEGLVRQVQEQTAALPPNSDMPKTILVVDDDASIRELLRQSLEARGYVVREAQDGLEAIARAKSVRPNLIVLDVMMPKINGFDTAAVLKNDPQTQDIPIIALSIFEDKARGYRLGIDRYLTKPIEAEELLVEIDLLLSQGRSNKKVLIVDGNASALANLSRVLQAQGYQVSEAIDGKECIEKALSLQPDTIIVDSLMSQQHDLMKTLRFEKGLDNVLFILLGDHQNDNFSDKLDANVEIL
ncbi:MAG: response regulator [Cyanobacteria bacterium SBLK]|nr:response regulator [Cyanobacteria bacterium SBLK]